MSLDRGTTGPVARPQPSTLDPAEVERFERLAKEWWNPHGKFRPLHQIGPVRLAYIRDQLIRHFSLGPPGLKVLEGLTLLDVGCGGGLISEPLARLGARVTGIDPAARNIDIARGHAEKEGLPVDYRVATVEGLAAEAGTYDALVCLEVVEHVPDVEAFLRCCALLLRPGGLMILSTINRTLKSYALAIVAAEYVLGWLPRGTHRWDRFITTEELGRHLEAAGLVAPDFLGFTYDPLRERWGPSPDVGVNYLAAAAKPAAA